MSVADELHAKIYSVDSSFPTRLYGPSGVFDKIGGELELQDRLFDLQAHEFKFNCRKPQTLSWGPGGSTDAFHKLKKKAHKAGRCAFGAAIHGDGNAPDRFPD